MAYRPGRGLDGEAVKRLKARKEQERLGLPSEDLSEQANLLLGNGARKVARCGECSRPLEPEVVDIGRQLCLRCAGPVTLIPRKAPSASPESEPESEEGSSSSDLPAGSPVDDTPRAKATLVPRKEEPKADEGAAKPKPQLVKRKSFEEKAAETQARLEAKLAKFHQDQEQKRIQEEVMKMRRREKEKKKKKKEKKKEKEAKLGGKKSKRKLSE